MITLISDNCIARQDYTLQQRINYVENPGFLYYANGGSFIPGTLENALETQGPQRFFRNTKDQDSVLIRNIMTEMRNDNIIRLDGKMVVH